MRLSRLLVFSSFSLLLGTIMCATEKDVKVSDFPAYKAAVNSALQIFIELVQLGGPIGTFVGMATIALSEFYHIGEEDDKVAQEINYDRLDERMDALKFSVDHLLNEVKFQTLIEYQSEINAEYDHFRQIIMAFVSDPSKQYQEITKFISDYKTKNIENKIANYLNEASAPSKSLRNNLVEFASASRNNTGCHMRSSPNKLIYDFHVATLLNIYKGNMLLLSAFVVQNQLREDENLESHKKLVILRDIHGLSKIITSMKNSLPLVSDHRDLMSYINLQSSVKIEFKNVIQLFLEYNTNLRPRRKIFWFFYATWMCDDINNDLFKRGHSCFGTVRSCVTTGTVCFASGMVHVAVGEESNYYYDFGRLSEDPDRIYSYNGSRSTVWESKNSDCVEVFSRVCACICDQHNHPGTERSLYSGAIKAPDGYVITGVRFQKHLGIVYLQAQVGQLMPGAFVNKSSVRWLEPPKDLHAKVLNFNYDSRKLLLDDLYFDDAVLTGYQFYYHHTFKYFAMQIFGKNFLKPEFGSLDDTELIKDNIKPKKPPHINMETKIPGLKESKESFEVNLGNSSLLIKFGASNQRKDAGQTFVPFLDGTEATFEVESPLSGIGLLHYTNDHEYAGFIRPFLRSYNHEKILVYYENYLKNFQKISRLPKK